MSGATITRLRDLGEWSGGSTPSKANAVYWSDGTIPWVSPKDMKVDEVTSSEDRVSEAALKEGRVSLLPEGSVLIVTRSGILSHTLPVAVTKTPVTINQDLKALTPKQGVLPKYVAHALRSASRRFLKQCSKHGTTVASIETNAMLDFEIPLVDLDEQRRIVAEIEKQSSRLDDALTFLKRTEALIAQYCQSILAEAVNLGCADGGLIQIGSLLRQPIVNGLSVKESKTSTEVRALRLSAMSASGLDYSDHRYLPLPLSAVSDILINEGDFFVSRGNGSLALVGRGTMAQVPPYPVIFPDTMMRLRFADPDVLRWIRLLWPSRFIRQQIEARVKTTAGIYKISQPQVASICIPMPRGPARNRIADEVEGRLTCALTSRALATRASSRAQALRQSILTGSFALAP